MNKVFKDQIISMLEVYMDDMIVKTNTGINHAADLTEVFAEMRKHNTRLNHEKCTFGIKAREFLGFFLTGMIKANPDKCRAVAQMRMPTTRKEI